MDKRENLGKVDALRREFCYAVGSLESRIENVARSIPSVQTSGNWFDAIAAEDAAIFQRKLAAAWAAFQEAK